MPTPFLQVCVNPAAESTTPETLESATDPKLSPIWCSRGKACVLLLQGLHENYISLHSECVLLMGNTFFVYLERQVIAMQRPRIFKAHWQSYHFLFHIFHLQAEKIENPVT